MKSFSPRNWFEELFGFKESVESVQENIKIEDKGDHVDLISKHKDRVYNAGNFQVRTSDRSTYTTLPEKGDGGGKLNIVHGYGSRTKHFELIDILSMQSLSPWNGATYLAASNFNCLEFTSPHQTAAHGVTSYYADPTQGPYTALACGPSIVYRNYFIEHDGVTGQISKEIELLKDTPIPVINGYAIIDKDEDILKELAKKQPIKKTKETPSQKDSTELLQKKLNEFQWDDPSIWKVGVHRNCEVVMKRGQNRSFEYSKKGIISHHVYAAAFNFAFDVVRTELTEKISRELLRAEYRAAILAAWENSILFPDYPGSKKLSLTLLGGGVFQNPPNIICDSIRENIELIKESGLDVYITCFSDEIFRQVMCFLGDLPDETGGSVIDADDDDDCKDLIGE